MIVQLRADKITPYAVRRPHGVGQTLVTYDTARPRSTIDKLLLPYRSLTNEIYLSPLPDYVERVLKVCDEPFSRADISIYVRIGIVTCLLAPIAEAKPQDFLNYMFKLSAELLKLKAEAVRLIVVQSITVHQKLYPELVASF